MERLVTFKLLLRDACPALDPVLEMLSTTHPEWWTVVLCVHHLHGHGHASYPFEDPQGLRDCAANPSRDGGCQPVSLTPTETLSLSLLLPPYNLRAVPFLPY